MREILYQENYFLCSQVGNGRFPADEGGGGSGDVISTHASCLSSLTHLSLFNCRGLTSAGLVALAQHCASLLYLNTEEVAGLGEEATNKMLSRLGPQLKGLFIDGEGLDDGAFANLNKCEKLEVRTIFLKEMIGVGIFLFTVRILESLSPRGWGPPGWRLCRGKGWKTHNTFRLLKATIH